MTRYAYFLINISFAILLSGCLPISGPGVNPEYNDGDRFAKKTLDIASSSPDLIIQDSQKAVEALLTELGADNKFSKKRVYRNRIRSTYLNEKVIDWDDAVLLNYDGVGDWMNIIVLKELNGETSLWVRKATVYNYQPAPESSYYTDWVNIIKSECLKRGIRFL